MFNKVDANLDFLGREKEVLAFWKENDIFKKSLTLRDCGLETAAVTGSMMGLAVGSRRLEL